MNFSVRYYQKIVWLGDSLQWLFLLAIRLFWGCQFFLAGYGKIQNMESVIEYFSFINIPLPHFMALAVGWIECIGGLCLIFGFISRLAAIPLAIVMIVALLTAHQEATWNLFTNFLKFIAEAPVTFLLTCLIVFCFGPGKVSLDYLFQKLLIKKR